MWARFGDTLVNFDHIARVEVKGERLELYLANAHPQFDTLFVYCKSEAVARSVLAQLAADAGAQDHSWALRQNEGAPAEAEA